MAFATRGLPGAGNVSFRLAASSGGATHKGRLFAFGAETPAARVHEYGVRFRAAQ